MPCLKNGMALMLFRRSEKTKHRVLGSLRRKDQIVTAIEHQGRNLHPLRNINVCHCLLNLLPPNPPNTRITACNACCHGRHDPSPPPPPILTESIHFIGPESPPGVD